MIDMIWFTVALLTAGALIIGIAMVIQHRHWRD